MDPKSRYRQRIDAALGVQEGSYLLLGGLLGVPPDIALAVALARRVRELLLGIPGLAVWQLRSARALVSASREIHREAD